MNDFVECYLVIDPNVEENREIVSAMLAEEGFETFCDAPEGLYAYISKQNFNIKQIEPFIDSLSELRIYVKASFKNIETINWNTEWEKNFPPIIKGSHCVIKAPFHQGLPDAEIVIEIMPKMSFGTGHHQTTSMMIDHLFEIDCSKKQVIDMGCGTGILSILAEKKGALGIVAIDIDDWAYENTVENLERNHCAKVKTMLGGKEKLNGLVCDILLANINRNILLEQISDYANCTKSGSILVTSGYYLEDREIIRKETDLNGFRFISQKQEGQWISEKFIKL